MKTKVSQIYIFGANRQGGIVLEILRSQEVLNIGGFLDDDVLKHGKVISGVPVVGGMEWVKANADRLIMAIVAIGNNETRIAIGNQLREYAVELINVIHPSAVVMGATSMGVGNLICAGSVIVTGTRLEDYVVVNTGATIDHDSILHSGAYVAPGVHTAGRVTIGHGAFVGVGTALGPNVTIGEGSIIGAGSLVLSDLPPRVFAFGTPAKAVKPINDPVNWKRILSRS